MAALAAAGASDRPLLIVSDSQYVVRGCGRLAARAGAPDARHGDLWAALWALGGGETVLARWAPARRPARAPPPPFGGGLAG